ncbi:MAG: DUF4412 domain-containing protein, partial [Lewinellaceae bacterium]|nr:DUF4412 domain-containing protein [Lewinellaceae bacterium]
MSKIYFCLGVLILCLGSLPAQKTFYGTIHYSYTVTGDNAAEMAGFMPTNMILKYAKTGTITWIRGGLMDTMFGRVVINEKTNDRFIVQDPTRTVYTVSEEDMVATNATQSTPEVKALDETQEIMGYTCRKYQVTTLQDGQEAVQQMWITDQLRLPKRNSARGGSLTGSMGFSTTGLPGIPLLVEIVINNGALVLTMEATKLEAGKIPSAEFQRPPGYTVK